MAISSRIVVERLDQRTVAAARTGSVDALAFNDPALLDLLCEQVDWWAACIGADVLVAWPACRPYGGEVRAPYLSYFVGPFRGGHCESLAMHRRVPLVCGALQCLATELCREYGSVKASFPPGFDDLRALTWWSGALAGRRARLTPRWTARLAPLSAAAPSSLHGGVARNRRRDIASIGRAPPEPTGAVGAAEFEKLYLETFERQQAVPEPERFESLRRTLTALDAGHGELAAWRDPADGSLAAALLVVDGPNDANDVLCAAAPAWRERGVIAWATWQGVMAAARRGRSWFDFNGANSPVRGPDKHHYGAAPLLYFDVELEVAG